MVGLWHELPRFLTWYNLAFLLTATVNTLLLSVVGGVAGGLAGLCLGIVRAAPGRAMAVPRGLAWCFTESFRRLPPLVVLLLAFFGASVLQLDLGLFYVALFGLSLIAAASLSEIVRGGIASVHRNQWDSSATLNFGYLRTVLTVILPQAWRVIIPPAVSFTLLFIKDTAFASQIGTLELTFAGKVLTTKGFSAALAYGTVLLIYFALSYALARLGRIVETRIGIP